MLSIDKKTFFAYCRRAPFGGRLTQQQVDGLTNILETAADNLGRVATLPCLAYIFATAFHETGGRMEPVREGFAKTDVGARKVVASRKYGVVDPVTNHVYYGRGYVQITWAENYKRLGTLLNYDLYRTPDLALQPHIAAELLVRGMTTGAYTGKKLLDYFTDEHADPRGARRIINGTDKADLIASYYEQFLGALRAADMKTPLPEDVTDAAAKPDKPTLATDRTTIGAITSGIGSLGLGSLVSVIDNPYALAAFGVAALLVGVGAILFLTGRLKIRHEGGV